MRNEKRDLRELKDTLPLALRCVELRFERTGDMLTIAELNRYALELIYASELQMAQERETKRVFGVEVLPQKL